MVIPFPGTLRSSAGSLSWLAEIANRRDVVDSKEAIQFDLSNVRDFDANLCAALGVIIAKLRNPGDRMIEISPTSPDEKTLAVFKRNGFLSELPLPKVPWYESLFGRDPEKSIQVALADDQFVKMPYKKFKRQDVKSQTEYVGHLVESKWWPQMTAGVRDALMDCILEVFNNAQEHSESEAGVFVCGHVGEVSPRLMRVSIADAGIGFRQKIERVLGCVMSSAEAIEWGMTEGNTVRKDNPGGLGLKILKEFISKNNGKLSVLSDRGYWELAAGKERKEELESSFPGTVITIAVNTEDRKSYFLAGEDDAGK